MAGTEYNASRSSEGCTDGSGFNCRLSHSLEVRISTLETTVKNVTGTYSPLIPLSDRMRDNVASIAEMASHSKHHVMSLLDRVQKLEDNSHNLSITLTTVKSHVSSVQKSHKYQSETVAKLLEEHQTITNSLRNEEVCRRLSTADLDNVKKDRDELYDKQEELEKEINELKTKLIVESSTRATAEATTRRIFAVAGGVITLICTIISVIVPFILR